MTESELAFLALGMVLGAAGGAALVVVLGSQLPRREIRVTVTRGAVPRRSPTLAIDAFVTRPPEPAPGGPGDRRLLDRPAASDPATAPRVPVGPGRGAEVEAPAPAGSEALERDSNRTIVPSASPSHVAAPARRPSDGVVVAVAVDAARPAAVVAPAADTSPAMLRILRGDHGAMLQILDALAGADGRRRRDWEILLAGLTGAIAETATDEGILDFPMGVPFWDAFTVEQCREITASLASMGYRFDGRDGWLDGRQPGYRELSQALADVGVNPIRIRTWPNSTEIGALFRGARPAAEDLVVRDAPDLQLEAVRELTRWHADSLADLWLAWDEARPLLLSEGALTR